MLKSLRTKEDLDALECPQKYKTMGQFHRYFTQEKRAPILTLFVGGNHEASNLLRDLYYGGWVAENIYYLGASGIVKVKKGEDVITVGGISGIDKHYDYLKGYNERFPYVNDHDGLRSIYHIRQFEVQKLKMVGKYSSKFSLMGQLTFSSAMSGRHSQLRRQLRSRLGFSHVISLTLSKM